MTWEWIGGGGMLSELDKLLLQIGQRGRMYADIYQKKKFDKDESLKSCHKVFKTNTLSLFFQIGHCRKLIPLILSFRPFF